MAKVWYNGKGGRESNRLAGVFEALGVGEEVERASQILVWTHGKFKKGAKPATISMYFNGYWYGDVDADVMMEFLEYAALLAFGEPVILNSYPMFVSIFTLSKGEN